MCLCVCVRVYVRMCACVGMTKSERSRMMAVCVRM